MNPKTSPNLIFHPGFLVIQSTLSLMFGIGYTLQFPNISFYFALATLIPTGLLAIIFRQKKSSHIFILLFTGSIGMILGLQTMQLPQFPHIRGIITQPTTLTCSGIIHKSLASNRNRIKLILDLDTIYTSTPLTTTSVPILNNLYSTQTFGLVQLSMPAFQHNHLHPGDNITVKAKLSPPRGFVNQGGFNLPFFLQSRNIFISGWVPRPENIIRNRLTTTKTSWFPLLSAEKIRDTLIHFYNSSLDPTNASLYRALITGDRSGLTIKIQEMFKNLGIYHLLAISGLHMGLLAGFVMWASTRIMRLFPNLLLYIPAQQGGAILAMGPVILYCFISGLQPPAVRACLMTVVLFSAFIFRKQWHGPTAIAIAALVLLIHNPLLLAMVSFQLSFVAVTAIVLILPSLKKYFSPTQKILPWFTTCKYTIISGFLISLVASVATLPLLLFHFNRVSLVSPITTLIMEPLLCLWALGFGLAGSLCLFLVPPVANGLLYIGSLGFDIALWIGNCINQIPHLTLWWTTPAVWKIFGFYLSLSVFSMQRNKQSALCFLACTILLFVPQSRDIGADKITIIDVGKGNSSLIECQSGKSILIDCGGPHSTTFNIGRQIIAPFLYHQQIHTLDLLILSHADLDHYSGATFLIHHFKPKELWIPYIHADNRAWKIMIQAARKQNTIIRIPQLNTSYPLKNNRFLTNISQTHLIHKDWSQNEQSLVIRYYSKPYSFLFPGDIEEKSEHLLLQHGQSLQSTVLVAPHHGSKSSSTLPFIKKVQPRYVVFSSSRYGTTPFPNPGIVKRYQSIGSIPLQTAINGALVFTLNPEHLKISTCLP